MTRISLVRESKPTHSHLTPAARHLNQGRRHPHPQDRIPARQQGEKGKASGESRHQKEHTHVSNKLRTHTHSDVKHHQGRRPDHTDQEDMGALHYKSVLRPSLEMTP